MNDSGTTNQRSLPTLNLVELERLAVIEALRIHEGNRTHAARTLGISTRTLQRKIAGFGLPTIAAPTPKRLEFD
jgi:DNA-binding NtrC family response regulator